MMKSKKRVMRIMPLVEGRFGVETWVYDNQFENPWQIESSVHFASEDEAKAAFPNVEWKSPGFETFTAHEKARCFHLALWVARVTH